MLEDDQLDFFGDSNARKAYDKSINILAQSGLSLDTVDLSPFLKAAELLYDGPWVAERHIATVLSLLSLPNLSSRDPKNY